MAGDDSETSNSDSMEGSYNSDESDQYETLQRKMFGKSASKKSETLYCCFCAGKHSEENCSNKTYNKSD